MATAIPAQDYVRLNALMDTGRVRAHNEDNFIVCPDLGQNQWYVDEKPTPLSPAGCLLVVADGMGGANAGEVASEICVERIRHFFTGLALRTQPTDKQAREYLNGAIQEAHQAIVAHAAAYPDCEGMGTTIVMAWVLGGKAVLAWCGDSRGYLLRPGEDLRMVTRDHSLVWELVEAGQLSPEEADVHPKSNFITQNLGNPENLPKPDVAVVPLRAADRLLLCSDGLNNMIGAPVISRILGQPKDLVDISQELVEAANENGGNDNITVVMLEVLEHTPPPKPPLKKLTLAALLALGALLLLAAGWWVGKGREKEPAVAAARGRTQTAATQTAALPPKAAPPSTVVKDLSVPKPPDPAPASARAPGTRPKKEVAPAPPAPAAPWSAFLDRVVAVVSERDKVTLPDRAPALRGPEDTVRRYFEEGLHPRDSLAAPAPSADRQALLQKLDSLLDQRNFREWAKKWNGGSPREEVIKQATAEWTSPDELEAEIKKAEALLTDIANS